MGRHNEVSLPYFELDCHMDDKVELIQAEYGLKGFAVIVKLYQKIYGGEFGYYCEWNDEISLLFASQNGLGSGGKNLINDIVSACFKRNIFSEQLYKDFGVLTSAGVQKQYLKATAKRKVVELKKEYLLISIPENRENVVINSIDGVINSIDDGRNQHSNSKSNSYSNNPPISPFDKFEDFATAYPKEIRNRYLVERAYMNVLSDNTDRLTEQDLIKAAENYAEAVRILWTDDRYIKQAQNWLKDYTFKQYLDGNYTKPKPGSGAKKNGFNDFQQNDYDFDALEADILKGCELSG